MDSEKQVEKLVGEVAELKRRETKNARRDNLNRNLLTRFGKEMWASMLIISVTCGFAIGVFLVNMKLSQEARQCAVQIELGISR